MEPEQLPQASPLFSDSLPRTSNKSFFANVHPKTNSLVYNSLNLDSQNSMLRNPSMVGAGDQTPQKMTQSLVSRPQIPRTSVSTSALEKGNQSNRASQIKEQEYQYNDIPRDIIKERLMVVIKLAREHGSEYRYYYYYILQLASRNFLIIIPS